MKAQKNKYLKITNKGIIDVDAFSLIGASTKRDDSTKIGWFGSGLKYSLAYLLRNELDFKFFAGKKEIVFGMIDKKFRNNNFKVITVNKKESSLTTDMGMDWISWFIIREIYCNAIDEGGEAIELVDKVIPDFKTTTFFLKVDENIQEIIDNWDSYFSLHRKNVVYEKNGCRIFPGHKSYIVYRKGIRALHNDKIDSIFHYDMTWAEINESRVLKSQWDFEWKMVSFLRKIDNVKVISKILRKINNCREKEFNWDTCCDEYSGAWLEAIKERILVKHEVAGYFSKIIDENRSNYLILPAELVNGLKSKFEDQVSVIDEDFSDNYSTEFTVLQPTTKQEYLLNEVNKFFEETGYKLSYPVNVCVFERKNKLGLAWKNQIYISEKAFNQGRRQIAQILVEENEHLRTGFNDETRAFQNHFIELFLSTLEEGKGIFL